MVRAQHGHRDKRRTMAAVSLRRRVAIEFAMWRSVLSGGAIRRLVIDDRGATTVYDTGSHRIFGVAQAQSADRTLTFTSQDGLIRVAG